MQFIVLGYDGEDEGAHQRRQAVREAHLRVAEAQFQRGRWLYAAGILDDDERLIGSMVVGEYASREDLEKEWLKLEPYMLGDVWREVQIHRVQVAPFCLPSPGRPGGSNMQCRQVPAVAAKDPEEGGSRS